MIALDARTGERVKTFGNDGIVDLKQDDDQDIDPLNGEIGLHATPIVAKDVVIVGAAHRTGANPKSMRNVKGFVRGYDVRTGERLWIFHTIPKPGEFGTESWLAGSAEYTGNTGVWAQISVDEELETVYLPVEQPTGDYFGANRPGDGLFGETLLAVDLYTGKRKWHYQLVHHGIWDNDIPCAPILIDVTVDGKTIKAVAQPTKQAFLYVFDRVTGKPVWPIEERPVPKGDVPGEWYSPTQPFPTKPRGLRPAGRDGRRSRRLHAGAQEGSARGRVVAQDGAAVHAARREQDRRAARHADGAEPRRRHELAGRLVRSRDEHSLRRVGRHRREQRCRRAVPGPVGHGVHRRQRGHGAAHVGRLGLVGGRRPQRVSGCGPGALAARGSGRLRARPAARRAQRARACRC